ncbi:Dimeric alpha-beta barrel protein [Rutstroemia sp. NJR-2017a WRK4]|nr:Dimeric alpha-beta barrel protein [Rutstroemia sp. NJR-2017a WRK4]
MATGDGPVTEICRITLKPNVDIAEESKDFKIWREALDTVASQDGFVKSYYGTQLEAKNEVVWCIDWTSISAHRAFEASSAYQLFKEKLGVIMEDVIVFHINQISKPLPSPAVIEIATFYGTDEVFIHGLGEFKKAVENLKEVPRGYLSWMDWGSSFEMIRKGGDGEKGEGEKGTAVVLMLAWRSMEDHMAFRDTEDFKSVIGYLREGTTGAEMMRNKKRC